ncbi:MAG TPA: inositol oxygenase family protein, partial [Casimicrobium huifangae]|nr:inositol oxygenase family protein [Casimicrobium huifangae]
MSETLLATEEKQSAYRDYAAPQRVDGFDTVREFYRLNHMNQTYDFVRAKKAEFLQFNRRTMT